MLTAIQERALAFLETLTPAKTNTRTVRETMLLPYGAALPEVYANLPEAEFCAGWAFSLGPHFSSALDVLLQWRKRNKTPYATWTQGSQFSFKTGYTLGKSDGSMLVQVVEASPAKPAFFNLEAWPHPPERG